MSAIFGWLWEKIQGGLEWIRDQLLWILSELFELVAPVFWAIFEWVGLAVIWFVKGIPVPGWLDGGTVQDALNAIPSTVWWLVEFIHLDYGLALVFGALALRFLVRRLPIIG